MHTSLTRRSNIQRKTPSALCDLITPTIYIVTPNSIIYEKRRVSPNEENGVRYAGVPMRDSVAFDLHDALGKERHNDCICYY